MATLGFAIRRSFHLSDAGACIRMDRGVSLPASILASLPGSASSPGLSGWGGARRVEASSRVGFRDDEARAVLAAIDQEETIAFLRDLVRSPSVNPPGDIAEAIAICQRPLQAAGFDVRTYAHEP